MLPWGHAAVGYLCYVWYVQVRLGVRPRGLAVVALGLGAQLPDLLDKPLTYQFAVLPSGRSLGHSLVFTALLLGVVWVVASSRDRRPLAVALAIGYMTHVFADGLYPLFTGNVDALRYLAYPFVASVEYDTGVGFLTYLADHLIVTDLAPTVLLEIGLAVIAAVLWYRHGLPGLEVLVGRDPPPEGKYESQ